MLGSFLRRFSALLGLGVAAALAQTEAEAPHLRWQPRDHEDRGLLHPDAILCPFDEAREHPANRVFRAIWCVKLRPVEVAAVLPRERAAEAEFFTAGWYFEKRGGRDGDERWFGGDGLQLPREQFTETESAALVADLSAIDGELAASLRESTRSCIWLQSDLLRTARRLLDTGSNRELLVPLLRAAERLALPAAALDHASTRTFAPADLATIEPELRAESLVELDRRSSRLFDAEHSLLWSRVYVQWPQGAELDLDRHLARTTAKEAPNVPLHTRAVLVQGLVAMDDQGQPRATGVVVDVRLQHLANLATLNGENDTTTRDGIAFRVFWLERQTLRERGSKLALTDFRELANDDQVLFRDYGSLKHTTVAGQCSLCHRRTNTPEPELMGFPVLRATATPKRAVPDDVRLRRAEEEFARFLAALRTAAK